MDAFGNPPISSRYSNLKNLFKLSVHSLLTAFSKEDVWKTFPTYTDAERERLYLMFVKAIKSLHGNIEVEFETMCQEVDVGRTLDIVEQYVLEHSLDVLAADKTNVGDIKAKISKAKMDEIQYLTWLLQKAEVQNNVLKARIESLKTSGDFSSTTDVVEKDQVLGKTIVKEPKLRNWNSVFEKLHGSWNE